MKCPYRNQFDKIVAYVREELPPEEQEAFEAHFLGCDECAHNVLWVQKTALLMERHGQYIFAPAYAPDAGILARYADRFAHGFERLSWSLGKWRPAFNYAALILIVTTVVWLFHEAEKTLHESGDDANFKAFLAGKGGSAPIPPAFDWPDDFPAISDARLRQRLNTLYPLYRKAQFAAVADSLELFANHYPQEPQIQMLWGIVLLQNRKFEKAVQRLSPLAKEEAPAEVFWFLAHAHLQQRHLEEARGALLELLHRPPHDFYHQSARKLLDSLQQ